MSRRAISATSPLPRRSGHSFPYLPVPVAPDGGAPDDGTWACSCALVVVWTFEAPALAALPVSSTVTQRPPRWLPVSDGTHTLCFPLVTPALFTPALGPEQAVAIKRISPTKPICTIFVITLIPTGKKRQSSRNSVLRMCWQRDRSPRAQGRFQRMVIVLCRRSPLYPVDNRTNSPLVYGQLFM